MLVEPLRGPALGDDREDADALFRHVVEDAEVIYPQTILRLADSTQLLDAALALLLWFVP
jgi:hypothetical protein